MTETSAPVKNRSKVKAITAIAVGTLLLIGGGSTVAYWSTQTTLQGASIETGDLNLELNGDLTWTLVGAVSNSSGTAAELGSVKIVPGDVLTVTQALDVTVVGDTLEADLAIDAAGVVDSGVASAITTDVAVTGGGVENAGVYRFTDSASVTATVTITFDEDTLNRDHVTTDVNLNEIEFTLTQATS